MGSSHSASEYVYIYSITVVCARKLHCNVIHSLLNLANHHSADSPSPPRDDNNNNNNNRHQVHFTTNTSNGHPTSISNPNSNTSSNGSTSRPYKRSDKFAIARQNIRSSSGNGYSSLSTKSVQNTGKTQFDFSSVTNNSTNNDSPPSNRRYRTISPRADLSVYTKTSHTISSPVNHPIRRQFPSTLARLPSGTDVEIGTRSKSNPNILGIL